MKEVNFQDRVPLYPNRVIMTPVPNQANTFDMVRADEPTKEGTPLDKATFNSIIHSRLTGRYYEPTYKRISDAARSGLTVSPIPSSNWVYDTDNRYIGRSGLYVVQVSSDSNTSSQRAGDAFNSVGWRSEGGLESVIKIYHTQTLKVEKMRITIELQNTTLTRFEIQGSANGTTWQALGTYSSVTEDVATDYTLTNTNDYNYYRLVFTSNSSNRVTVKDWRYSLYDVSTYINSYTLEDVPTVWTVGQRIMMYTPPSVNTYAVISNNLNGININTILQNGKRYELRYNGTAFDAKEV